ncbi:hypothetical protein Tco_0606410 [Tanacetum coccineum]
MLLLSLCAIPHFSPLQMFLKFTCTNFGILSTSMILSTGSEWIKRRNSTLIWKSLETSFRSALEFMVKILMNFPLMKILCLSSNNLVILGKSSQSPMLLLIRCINLGELLPLSSTEVYLERQLIPLGVKRLYGFLEVTTTQELDLLRRHESSRSLLLSTHYCPSFSGDTTKKSKRVKRPTKKSTNVPTAGVIIIDTLVMPLSKKKEKVTVKKRKGIDLLSEVALTKEAQYKEVRKKSLRDFHKTNPSGSVIVTSVAKIKPSVTNEGTSSESDQEENKEEVEDDEEEKEDESVKTPSNYTSTDDEDETNFDDDVDVRLNEPVNTDEGFIQKEGTDAKMINVQQGNENLEITLNQVIEDAHVHFSTVTKRTEVPEKTSKDVEPTKGPKTKESKSGSSKGTKYQSKSSRKYIHAEEPEFEVTYSDIPQDQEENMGNDDEEPKRKVESI